MDRPRCHEPSGAALLAFASQQLISHVHPIRIESPTCLWNRLIKKCVSLGARVHFSAPSASPLYISLSLTLALISLSLSPSLSPPLSLSRRKCAFVCVHVCVCLCMRTCLRAYVRTWVRACVYYDAHMSVHESGCIINNMK